MTYAMRSNRAVIRQASFDEITHFVAGEKYVVAHTKDGELILDETLVQISASHPELVYTHRSTLVRAGSIDRVDRNPLGHDSGSVYRAVLKCGTELKVSRYQYKRILDLIAAREAA